jgi:hypothetical protein
MMWEAPHVSIAAASGQEDWRVCGLSLSLLENKDKPAEVERIASELLALEPHLLEMLIAEGEKAPALT